MVTGTAGHGAGTVADERAPFVAASCSRRDRYHSLGRGIDAASAPGLVPAPWDNLPCRTGSDQCHSRPVRTATDIRADEMAKRSRSPMCLPIQQIGKRRGVTIESKRSPAHADSCLLASKVPTTRQCATACQHSAPFAERCHDKTASAFDGSVADMRHAVRAMRGNMDRVNLSAGIDHRERRRRRRKEFSPSLDVLMELP